MEIGIGIGLLIMLVTHILLPRYWQAGLLAAVICSLTNAIHEAYLVDFVIRPSDAMAWIPFTLLIGLILFSPASFLVGLPFWFYRKNRKKRKGI